jgi:hypothetical protein
MFKAKFEGTVSIFNVGWTKWEAVQFADELEANQEMKKADWECLKKLEDLSDQINGPFFSKLDNDDQEQARWDTCTRERWNSDFMQMAKDMDMLPYSPSPYPQQLGSCTKDSNQWKQREKGEKIWGNP